MLHQSKDILLKREKRKNVLRFVYHECDETPGITVTLHEKSHEYPYPFEEVKKNLLFLKEEGYITLEESYVDVFVPPMRYICSIKGKGINEVENGFPILGPETGKAANEVKKKADTLNSDIHNPKVFISYVRENSDDIDRLQNDLESKRVEVWRDAKDLYLGDKWKVEIRKAIQRGDFFIACFSIEYHNKRRTYMNEELNIAIEESHRRKREDRWIFPVMLSDCEIPDWDVGEGEKLSDIHGVKLYKEWDKGVEKIAQAIRDEMPENDDGVHNRSETNGGTGVTGKNASQQGEALKMIQELEIKISHLCDAQRELLEKSGVLMPEYEIDGASPITDYNDEEIEEIQYSIEVGLRKQITKKINDCKIAEKKLTVAGMWQKMTEKERKEFRQSIRPLVPNETIKQLKRDMRAMEEEKRRLKAMQEQLVSEVSRKPIEEIRKRHAK